MLLMNCYIRNKFCLNQMKSLVVVFASVSFQPSFGDIGERDRYQKRANSIALKHRGRIITLLKLGCINWVQGEVVFFCFFLMSQAEPSQDSPALNKQTRRPKPDSLLRYTDTCLVS